MGKGGGGLEGHRVCNKRRDLPLIWQNTDSCISVDGDLQMKHGVQFWVPHFLSDAGADDVNFFLFVA